ncbi:hypothetical protein [Nocardia sp. NRRL S-836]|uniref:hypothetical protein n=1 Tax=Nocardia sp. NRRL S-836 TaxID=1519492 RepID=UPI0006B011C7|nr:hypothetical protein [Nocardia sp. NRRL S-836]KOV81004.1 hypothetical protein ADL03_30515 [Nocardia sp. NRRL S-836]
MANDYSADPRVIAAVAEGFEIVGGFIGTMTKLSLDRRTLLVEACGDDTMGEEIRQNLEPVVQKYESALIGTGEVVANQEMVAKGMAAKIQNAEHDNTSNVINNTRRHSV